MNYLTTFFEDKSQAVIEKRRQPNFAGLTSGDILSSLVLARLDLSGLPWQFFSLFKISLVRVCSAG